MHRHKDLEWSGVQDRLESHPDKLWSLNEMEAIGAGGTMICLNKYESSNNTGGKECA
ncbi:MAG: DUF4256 domain-containing protein [Bacteroidales bacterium]|nr:DUF4256 domain-containing protein [Bacteroidales bacterium]